MGFVTNCVDYFLTILGKLFKQNYTSVVFSEKSIEVTDLRKKNGTFTLNSFLEIESLEKEILGNETSKKLNQACIENHLASKKIQTLGTGEGTIVRNVTIPEMEEDEIINSLKYSEMDSIPFNIFEASVDAMLLPSNSNDRELNVLMGVLDKKVVTKYSDFFKNSCLRHTAIGTIPDALSAILKNSKLIDKSKLVPIFNITEKNTGIYIFKNDSLSYSRQIPLGTKKITKNFSDKNIVSERTDWDKAIAEYERSLDFFKNKTREEIDTIYLVGGSDELKEISNLLSRETNYNFKVYNPFDDFIELKNEDLQKHKEKGSRLTVSIGLAIKNKDSLND